MANERFNAPNTPARRTSDERKPIPKAAPINHCHLLGIGDKPNAGNSARPAKIAGMRITAASNASASATTSAESDVAPTPPTTTMPHSPTNR